MSHNEPGGQIHITNKKMSLTFLILISSSKLSLNDGNFVHCLLGICDKDCGRRLANDNLLLPCPGAGVAVLLDHDSHCGVVTIIGDDILGCLVINHNGVVDADLLGVGVKAGDVNLRSAFRGGWQYSPLAKPHSMRVRG